MYAEVNDTDTDILKLKMINIDYMNHMCQNAA